MKNLLTETKSVSDADAVFHTDAIYLIYSEVHYKYEHKINCFHKCKGTDIWRASGKLWEMRSYLNEETGWSEYFRKMNEIFASLHFRWIWGFFCDFNKLRLASLNILVNGKFFSFFNTVRYFLFSLYGSTDLIGQAIRADHRRTDRLERLLWTEWGSEKLRVRELMYALCNRHNLNLVLWRLQKKKKPAQIQDVNIKPLFHIT